MYASLRTSWDTRRKAPARGLSTDVVGRPGEWAWPVEIEEAKAHMRVESEAENALIAQLIKAATRRAEGYTKRAIGPQTLRASWDHVAADARLPRPPHGEVLSVYRPEQDVTLRVADEYRVTGGHRKTVHVGRRINIAAGYRDGALAVEYEAGYEAAGLEVPSDIKLAILRLVAHYYDQRTDEVAGTVVATVTEGARELLQQHKVWG